MRIDENKNSNPNDSEYVLIQITIESSDLIGIIRYMVDPEII